MCTRWWYPFAMAITQVRTSREAREELGATLARFQVEGAMAEPVIFGAHRKPQAAVIPFELYERLESILEDLELAETLASRMSQPSSDSDSLLTDLGFDPADFE